LGSASPRSVLMLLRDTREGLHYAVGLLLGRGDTVFQFKSFGGVLGVSRISDRNKMFLENELKFN